MSDFLQSILLLIVVFLKISRNTSNRLQIISNDLGGVRTYLLSCIWTAASLSRCEASLPWSYGSWIYNHLCNQCLSPVMVWVRISIRARCTTLCDKVCQWLTTGQWFSPISSTSKTDRHDITEILLKVALNTIKQINPWTVVIKRVCGRHPSLHMSVSDIILRFRPQ